MITIRKILFAFLLFAFDKVICQTVAVGEVNIIESKSNTILLNKQKIANLTSSRAKTYIDEEAELNRLKAKLNIMQEQKTILTEQRERELKSKEEEMDASQSWKNRLETARNGWKEKIPGECSMGGPPPICKVDHWYQVGYTAAMEDYFKTRKNELEKIKNNYENLNDIDRKINFAKNEIYSYGVGESQFALQRKKIDEDIKKLNEQNKDLCDQMVQHVKSHSTLIKNSAIKLHSEWIISCVKGLADKHYYEIIIKINNLKIKAVETEKAKAVENEKIRVKNLNDSEIADLTAKKTKASNDLITEEINCKNKLEPLKQKLFNLNKLKNTLSVNLTSVKSQKVKFDSISNIIAENDLQINNLQISISSIETECKSKTENLKIFIQMAQDSISNLFVILQERTSKAILLIDDKFNPMISYIVDNTDFYKYKLQNKTSEIESCVNGYENKNNQMIIPISNEESRIIKAFTKCECSVPFSFMDSDDKVRSNWQNVASCISQFDGAVNAYYGCEKEKNAYLLHFNSLISSLPKSDAVFLNKVVINRGITGK